MATMTGENLLNSIIESTGVEINALIFSTLSAKLQQMIDNGTYSNLAASIAMSGFSTVINDATEIGDLTDAVETNAGLIEAAADQDAVDEIDFPPIAEDAVGFSIGDVSLDEGDAGTTTATFTVTLNTAPGAGETVTVDYATADGTATVVTDYVAASGTLTFAEGETTKTVEVTVNGDLFGEEDETFNVVLSNATGTIGGTAVVINDATGVGTITDDEVAVTFELTAGTATVTEGATATYTVTASRPVDEDTVVSFALTPGNAAAIDQGTTTTNLNDFAAGSFNPTSVTILAGDTTATFDVAAVDDSKTELPETYIVTAVVDGTTLTVETSLQDGTSGRTMTLTAAADTGANFTGTSVADTYVGVVGGTATLTSGDYLVGGAGVDTLSVSWTGTGGETVAGVVLDGVEVISVADYTTAGAETINLAQATGVTDLNLNGSAATGDLEFTNVGNIVNSKMANGTGDLKITYTDAAVAGLADSATLTLANQTAGAYTVAGLTTGGIETLNIVSSTSKNTIAINDAATATIKTLNISGDQQLTLTEGLTNADDAVTTINAATMTGKLFVTTGSAAGNMTITGGTADDTITLGNFTAADTVDGGTGTDTLSVDKAAVVSADLAKVTNVEILAATAAAQTVTLTAAVAGLTSFNLADADNQTLTLSTGYTGDTTVTLTGDSANADTITNTANVKLTVVADAQDIDATTTIAGGTGTTDSMTLRAGDGNTTVPNVASTGTADFTATTAIDAINVAKGFDTGDDITLTLGTYATALTIDASALTDAGTVNAAGTATDGLDSILTVSGASATKALTVTGGAGWDVITTGVGNDTITSGAGNDTITSGTGNDIINAGAGNDTITMGANLTSADTIDGGEGTDTLQVTTITASALTGVTNVENLAVTGASTVSLTSNLAFTAIDISDAATQSVTFGTGYTNATTVNLKTDAGDTVVNTAKIALTVDATTATAITGSTLTGGVYTNTAGVITGNTDTLVITAGDGTAANGVASTATATFGTTITNFDSLTVRKGVDTGDDIVLALDAYTANMTIDASALTDAGTLNAAGTATTGNDSTLTVTATSTANLNITGGAGWDVLTLSGTANHTINTGAGNDSINLAGTLTNADTINGGDGTDTLSVNAGTTDVNYLAVSNVENLTLLTTGTTTLSSYASVAGITKVTGLATAANTIDASGMTTGVEMVAATTTNIDDVLTGGTGNDTFIFSGTVGLEGAAAGDRITGGTGTDTVRLDNSAGAVTAVGYVGVASAANTIYGVENFTVYNANGGDTAGSENADAISLTLASAADNATNDTDQTIALNASVITDILDTLTLDASGVVDTDILFTITAGASASTLKGGAAADTITGGSAVDTITGGAGADTVTGNGGADIFEYASTLALVSGTNAGASTHSTSAAADTITDFEAGSDKVRLTVTLGDNGETFKATDKGDATSLSNGTALLANDENGQYFFNTTDKQLVVDLDGNGLIQATDLVINMTGETGFNSADMIIDVTGGAGADTITTDGGADIIRLTDTTANIVETVSAGGGNDTIYAVQGSLNDTSSDVINGGADTDTLSISGTGTVAAFGTDGALTNVENITFTTDSMVMNLSAQTEALNVTTANGTNGVTFGTTAVANKFTGGTGVDTLTIGNQAALAALGTTTGGAGTDILTIAAASTDIVDANFANISLFETLTLTGISTAILGTNATAAGIATVIAGAGATTVTSTQTALTVDGATAAMTTFTTGAATANYTLSTNAATTAITATGSTGTLAITSGDATGDAVALATGTGNVTVSGGHSGDTITVTGMATASQSFVSTAASIINITAGAGAQTITTGAGADTIVGGDGADTITGGAGIDAITGGDGIDTISFTAVAAVADRDVVTGFTMGAGGDILGLDIDYTTVATAANAAAVFEVEAVQAANANGATYDMTGLLTANSNALDLIVLQSTCFATNSANMDLSSSTDGTELLQGLVATANAAHTATGITLDNVGDKAYILASDGTNSYLYYANTGANAEAVAAEILLVGTFNASDADAFLTNNAIMVA